jgi:uncharacterized protein DUF4255
MSDPLAISAVSAVLQYYLFNMYTPLSSMFGGQVAVSSKAPDLVQSGFGGADSAENQVNLFLHQVTYNSGWRNVALPSAAADGTTRLTSPPLALDLHYLLTAYGSADWQAEGLLGYALMLLHENPVLTREDISHALANLAGTNNLISALNNSTLADQVEMIKITPSTLGREEMAWLWTALKADYRPTFPFQVSVVLIQPQLNTSLALPVLRRKVKAQILKPARLLTVQTPKGQTAVLFTDAVVVTGEFLSGVSQVSLSNPRHSIKFAIPIPASKNTNTSLEFVPGTQTTYPAGVPPGIYSLVAQFTNSDGTEVLQSTNTLQISLAPTLPSQTQAAVPVPDNPLVVAVTVDFTPNIWEGQDVSLTLSSTTPPVAPATLYTMTAPAQPFTGNSNTSLSFEFPATLVAGKYLGRLQVDGVTSQVGVDWNVHPPVFTGPIVTVTL